METLAKIKERKERDAKDAAKGKAKGKEKELQRQEDEEGTCTAKAVTDVPPQTYVPPPVAEALGADVLWDLKVTELKDMCKRFGLEPKGLKIDLVGRLGGHLMTAKARRRLNGVLAAKARGSKKVVTHSSAPSTAVRKGDKYDKAPDLSLLDLSRPLLETQLPRTISQNDPPKYLEKLAAKLGVKGRKKINRKVLAKAIRQKLSRLEQQRLH